MPTSDRLTQRWRYLRDLLIAQLDHFEQGSLRLHANETDVSVEAIASVKRQIKAFDDLIAAEAGAAAPAGQAKRGPRPIGPSRRARMLH